MSSPAQFAANIANAQHSTGPRTPEGKSTSSKNSVTHGLFSGDFIRHGEEHTYNLHRAALCQELKPEGFLEGAMALEILRATWRLRRCGEVELLLAGDSGDSGEPQLVLDPMMRPGTRPEKTQQSVDRARAQALRIFHRCMAELRRLQAERRKSAPQPEPAQTQRTQSQRAETARSAPCPCNSGQKFKRCCGKAAPAVLRAA